MATSSGETVDLKLNSKTSQLRKLTKGWQLLVLVMPAVIFFLVFAYGPMYGIQIAFREYSSRQGIWQSQWLGMTHFTRFFNSYYFSAIIRNTLVISLYNLALGFPLPILLAISLNELKNGLFKKTVQTVTYAPYFISVVVMGGMIIAFLSPTTGIFNKIIEFFGGEPIPFLRQAGKFPSIFVLSNIWQGTGWGSIIYLAVLAGVDEQLHEAAVIDGAGRFQRIRHINIPHLIPTMVILLILNSGSLLSVGFEKILLLQNPLNTETSEVISTYVYKTGLIDAQYSFSTAVGLFNAVINLIVLVLVNMLARKVGENSLW